MFSDEKFTARPTSATEPHFSEGVNTHCTHQNDNYNAMYKPVGLSPIITTVIQINKLDNQKSLNIGHISYYNECRPITTTWPLSII